MKKIYVTPQAEVIEVKANGILCASIYMNKTQADNTSSLGHEDDFDWDE